MELCPSSLQNWVRSKYTVLQNISKPIPETAELREVVFLFILLHLFSNGHLFIDGGHEVIIDAFQRGQLHLRDLNKIVVKQWTSFFFSIRQQKYVEWEYMIPWGMHVCALWCFAMKIWCHELPLFKIQCKWWDIEREDGGSLYYMQLVSSSKTFKVYSKKVTM